MLGLLLHEECRSVVVLPEHPFWNVQVLVQVLGTWEPQHSWISLWSGYGGSNDRKRAGGTYGALICAVMAFCVAKVIQEKRLIVHCSIAFSDILYVLLLKSTQLSSYAVCLLLGALLSLLKEESNSDWSSGKLGPRIWCDWVKQWRLPWCTLCSMPRLGKRFHLVMAYMFRKLLQASANKLAWYEHVGSSNLTWVLFLPAGHKVNLIAALTICAKQEIPLC